MLATVHIADGLVLASWRINASTNTTKVLTLGGSWACPPYEGYGTMFAGYNLV